MSQLTFILPTTDEYGATGTIPTRWGDVPYDQIEGSFVLHQRPLQSPIATAYAAKEIGAPVIFLIPQPIQFPLIPSDFVDFSSNRETTIFSHIGTGYVQQDPPFCPMLTARLSDAGYLTTGPILICDELPESSVAFWWQEQEIEWFTLFSQPEGIICRELELCFALLMVPEDIDPMSESIPEMISSQKNDQSCVCDQTMALARQSGKLPADWKEWFAK